MLRAHDARSFAMIMVELFTGERLFKGMEAHQVMYQVCPMLKNNL